MERGGWRSGPSLSSSVPFSRAALRSWAEWRMSCSSATRVKARPPCPTAPEIESMFRVTCTAGKLRAREERETALLGCPGEELSSERREERVKIHARRSRRGEPSFSQGLTSKFGATVATPLLFSPARRRRVALRLCSRPPSSPNSPQFYSPVTLDTHTLAAPSPMSASSESPPSPSQPLGDASPPISVSELAMALGVDDPQRVFSKASPPWGEEGARAKAAVSPRVRLVRS